MEFPRTSAILVVLAVVSFSACKENNPGTGLVMDAAAQLPAPVEAGPVDINTCVGCQMPMTPVWSFLGIYRDAKCTEPLAQLTVPTCASVPAVGPTSLTYTDEVGLRKAGETAQVTLGESAPSAPRFRKTAKGCAAANEGAVDLTPAACSGKRVCRDASGALVCTESCRTLSNGCPDFEETRMYATIDDPGLKTAGATSGGSGSLARLKACCAQLAAEAKRLGASPEAGVLASAAAQCNTLVANAGSGNAPELGVLKTVLAGRNIPAVCSGF